jgi:hypothetical protein
MVIVFTAGEEIEKGQAVVLAGDGKTVFLARPADAVPKGTDKRLPLVGEDEISDLIATPADRMAWPFPRMRNFALDLRAARMDLRDMTADRDSWKRLSEIQRDSEYRFLARAEKLEAVLKKIAALSERNDYSGLDAIKMAAEALDDQVPEDETKQSDAFHLENR